MKRTIHIFWALFFCVFLNAQVPQAFKYQAVVRDNQGLLLADQSVNIKIDIIQGQLDGTEVYSESHSVQSNSYGIVNLEIGSGTTADDFIAIIWSADSYFIKLWINGDEMGTTPLLSVPYALHANSAREFTGDEIKNIMDPVDDQDVATKAYVDRQITNPGIRIHAEIDSLICHDDSDGAIDLSITGGTPPYIYEWDNGSTTEDLDGLSVGKYQVYVEGSKGMTAFRHFRLSAPEAIMISYVSTPGPGTIDITVSGGTPPYTFLWSNGSTNEDQSGLLMGEYSVMVSDALGCTHGETIVMGGESGMLAEYLEDPGSPAANHVNTTLPAITTASSVHDMQAAGKVYIVDIRSADSYAEGHIDGAVNVAAAEVRDHLDAAELSGYDEISIVCYTGQVSGWLTCLLRLAGYDNVYSMKFGMSAWHSDFDKWSAIVSNMFASLYTNDQVSKGPAGDLPVIYTGQTTPEKIFEARLETVLAEGFSSVAISVADVYANLDNYYIINYWSEADYLEMGHIEGAMQYTPKASMALDMDLKTLPTDKTIAVYGYTGQMSASLVAYLRILGYDAKSIKFGANAMIYDEMTKSKWNSSAIMEYDYVSN